MHATCHINNKNNALLFCEPVDDPAVRHNQRVFQATSASHLPPAGSIKGGEIPRPTAVRAVAAWCALGRESDAGGEMSLQCNIPIIKARYTASNCEDNPMRWPPALSAAAAGQRGARVRPGRNDPSSLQCSPPRSGHGLRGLLRPPPAREWRSRWRAADGGRR